MKLEFPYSVNRDSNEYISSVIRQYARLVIKDAMSLSHFTFLSH